MLSAAADCPFLPRDLVARLHQARIARGRAARGRGLRRPVASGDRPVERGLARGTAPRAGGGRHPQDRPLDRALPARHRDLADRRRSIRSSTPIRWTISRRPSGWRRWMAAERSTDDASDGPRGGAAARGAGRGGRSTSPISRVEFAMALVDRLGLAVRRQRRFSRGCVGQYPDRGCDRLERAKRAPSSAWGLR